MGSSDEDIEVEESADMGRSDEDWSSDEEEMELRPIKKAPWIGVLKDSDEFAMLWGWEMLLPYNVYTDCLIKEFADKVRCQGKTLSYVSTAALLCITKETDLICKMLSVDAKPSSYTIIRSTKIRMCALSLTSHQLRDSVPAAAAMLGIMKEADKICDWIVHNGKAFNVNDENLDHDFELGPQVRQGTLHFMTSLLQMSPFAVSAAVAAAEQKPVEEKYSSGNIPRNDENCIAPAEAANSTRGSTQEQEKIISTKSSRKRRMEDADEASDKELGSYTSLNTFAKTWLWDRLVPLRSPTGWSDYSNYLRQCYNRNASVVAEVTGSLAASAEVCLKKEELASCKEAELICELLKHGANRTDCIIEQSIMIRMCALSLMHLEGSHAIDAAGAMLGITVECKLMCDWIKKEGSKIRAPAMVIAEGLSTPVAAALNSFGTFTRYEPLECRVMRARILDVMLSILKESSFPSSKMWLDLVASN
ncbi:hypothetical protein HU200_061782 [Digitaria exilis]|uniref:Uncharacterized protein n=1 Tax=Digitaria exilis TaxID=1010633 RepID=A0A835AH69_9POAL|nr:hypothetical protein HU200_061782 [Digitaria exilis]